MDQSPASTVLNFTTWFYHICRNTTIFNLICLSAPKKVRKVRCVNCLVTSLSVWQRARCNLFSNGRTESYHIFCSANILPIVPSYDYYIKPLSFLPVIISYFPSHSLQLTWSEHSHPLTRRHLVPRMLVSSPWKCTFLAG
jgi:hypothetical protein